MAGADVSLLGIDVLAGDAVDASATCPVGGVPVADATGTNLTLLGDAATLSADTPTATASAALTGDLEGWP